MIKAVTFDLWNTLISERRAETNDDYRIRYLAKVLNEHDISRGYDEISEAYSAANDYAHRVWVEEDYRYVSVYERLRFLLKNLKAHLPTKLMPLIVKEFKETILRNPPALIEGVKEVLEFSKPKYKLGIICDSGITPGEILRTILEKEQILAFFEATIFSDEVGCNKPHRLMFETALKRLRINPSEAIHIGDLLQTDIAGAKTMGMKTVWFNREGIPETGQYSPDFEVDELPQLVQILKEVG